MDFTTRLAGPEDVPVVHEIMRETVAALPRKEFFVDDDREYLEDHIERDGFTLLALHGADCAGFLMVDLPGHKEKNLARDLGWPADLLDKCAHIDSVCVRPAYRGNGLQKLLVREGEARLTEMGIPHFLATVHPENAASLKSLLALGYQIGATKDKYGGIPRHILFKSAPQ